MQCDSWLKILLQAFQLISSLSLFNLQSPMIVLLIYYCKISIPATFTKIVQNITTKKNYHGILQAVHPSSLIVHRLCLVNQQRYNIQHCICRLPHVFFCHNLFCNLLCLLADLADSGIQLSDTFTKIYIYKINSLLYVGTYLQTYLNIE